MIQREKEASYHKRKEKRGEGILREENKFLNVGDHSFLGGREGGKKISPSKKEGRGGR